MVTLEMVHGNRGRGLKSEKKTSKESYKAINDVVLCSFTPPRRR